MRARGMPDGSPDEGSGLAARPVEMQVILATRLSSRLRGLLFSPETENLLVLLPCRDIHTFGMRYAIDVAFLDAGGRVCKVVRDVLPNKRLRDSGAVAVLERRAAPCKPWFAQGDRVSLGNARKPSAGGGSPSAEASRAQGVRLTTRGR